SGTGDFNGDSNKDAIYVNLSDSGQPIGSQYELFLSGTTSIGRAWVSGQAIDPVVMPSANEGTDTVLSSISYTLPSGVENLTLVSGAGAINGTGNSLDNAIIGNEGANVLTGGAGTDTLTGNAGADTFVFANGDTGSTSGHR